jgi:RNA polymerase sigma-70 factor (ECF subfamily)
MSSQQISLTQMVLDLREGKISWEEFYSRFSPTLLWWCMGNEDVAQEAWIKLINNIDKYDPSRPFEPWAKTVIKNIYISSAAKALKEVQTPVCHTILEQIVFDKELDPSLSVEYSEIISLLMEIIEEFPENHRLIVLKKFEGHTFKELSQETNLCIDTVKTIYFRLLNVIRKKIKNKYLELFND